MSFNSLLLCVGGFIIGAVILELTIIYVANDADGKKEIRDFFFKTPSLKEFLKMIGSSITNALALLIIVGILFIGLVLFLKLIKFIWYQI